MSEFLGHKLRDLVSYPEEFIKKIVVSKSDYFFFKKQEEKSQTEESESDSD